MEAVPPVGLVASFGGAVEPRVHAPERVDAPGVGRVRVEDDAVFEGEGTDADGVRGGMSFGLGMASSAVSSLAGMSGWSHEGCMLCLASPLAICSSV